MTSTTPTTSNTTSNTTTTDHTVVIRALASAMSEQRWDDVLALISNDVVAHVPARDEPLRGIDQLAMFIAETSAKADDGERFEVIDTLAGETHGAIYFRITATRPGRAPLDNFTVHLARLDGGRVAEIWFHNFDNDTVAAFWA